MKILVLTTAVLMAFNGIPASEIPPPATPAPVPMLRTPLGLVPVPDSVCDRTDDGWFIYVAPDGQVTINKTCVGAVKQWFEIPPPPKFPRA